MPRPNAPPTPASSTDIRGKEGSNTTSTFSFNLPPTAYNDSADRTSPATSSVSSAHASDSSYHPYSPPSPQHQLSRKRTVSQAEDSSVKSGSGIITKNDFSLPPPPTRSRKIIQMKPSSQAQSIGSSAQSGATTPSQATTNRQAAANGKKKQQSNGQATAAGRKIARKTAHSLIERRRRSKMNEEFGVLKDMIPACKGQEMHKLAILQAAIEYMQYLEKCVSDLKVVQQHNAHSPEEKTPASPRPSSKQQRVPSDEHQDRELDLAAMDEDKEMSEPPPDDSPEAYPENNEVMEEEEEEEEDAPTPPLSSRRPLSKSGSLVSLPSLSHITSTLPSTTASIYSSTNTSSYGSSAGARHPSISSAATYSPSFSPYLHSTHTSPAFCGQQSAFVTTGPTFSLSSPALKPIDSSACSTPSASEAHYRYFAGKHQQQLDASTSQPAQQRSAPQKPDVPSTQNDILDHEASAALLMLNNDRRNWKGTLPKESTRGALSTGMSVRDLLSG
ncbi:HLH-domain-containing protein [Polychaeton citri CBS 116435]|uniref:HLH-domain-containing protein n=1 Tax=Polychaeton citri CBS 116435 TaxID=1314669 RepID=A0A9P4QAT1_9PEZI|nr:HLH-domain-containing protein [Polychaeton citri CBS 116435]